MPEDPSGRKQMENDGRQTAEKDLILQGKMENGQSCLSIENSVTQQCNKALHQINSQICNVVHTEVNVQGTDKSGDWDVVSSWLKKSNHSKSLLNVNTDFGNTGDQELQSHLAEDTDTAASTDPLVLLKVSSDTGTKYYKCDFCGKELKHPSDLRKHYTVHTGIRAYACDVCGKRFTQASSLKEHQRIHTGDRPYKCHICSKEFTHLRSLKSHTKIHTGEKPHKCDICQKEFSDTSNLRRHTNKIHKVQIPTEDDLKPKKRTHTDGLLNKCDLCGKVFRQLQGLQRHEKVHSSDKPFSCGICGKEFKFPHHLRPHLRTHTDDRPFVCSTCGKAFAQSQDLHRHRRIHTGDKPFKCDICSRGFTQSHHLHAHYRTHTGDRPFQCGMCQKAFAQRGTLQRHQKMHSTNTPGKSRQQESKKEIASIIEDAVGHISRGFLVQQSGKEDIGNKDNSRICDDIPAKQTFEDIASSRDSSLINSKSDASHEKHHGYEATLNREGNAVERICNSLLEKKCSTAAIFKQDDTRIKETYDSFIAHST